MDKYVSDSGVEHDVSFDFDADRFGNIEMTTTLMMLKESGRSQILNTGVGGSVVSVPVYHDNRIYFGASDKNVYCVDLEGKEAWRFPTDGPVLATACIYDGVLYIGSLDGKVYALSADTGKELWRFRTNGKVLSSVSLDEETGHLIFGSEDGKLYVVSREGKRVWDFRTNGPITSTPAIDKDAIYFGSYDKNFYAIDRQGRVVWRFGTNNQIVCLNALHGDTICFGSFDHKLYALDRRDGRLLWTFKAGDSIYHTSIINDTVYFGSRDGCFYSVTLDGKLRWKFSTGEIVPAGPAVQGGVVYFGSGNNNFYAVDERTGRELWKFETNGPVFQRSVTLHDGVIYFGSWDCNVYAVTTKGRLVWKFPTSISTPSRIDVETDTKAKTAEMVFSVEDDRKEKKKYQDESGGSYDLDVGQYGAMDRGYTGHKKKGYVE